MIPSEPKYSLLRALVELKFITPRGITRWCTALAREGTTLMAMLRFAALTYPSRVAIIHEDEQVTYRELYQRALGLSALLFNTYGIRPSSRVALLFRNHLEAVLSIAALSRLGAGAYLLNSDLRPTQMEPIICGTKQYQLLIADEVLLEKCLPENFPTSILTVEQMRTEIKKQGNKPCSQLPKVRRGGVISVLSGGSSGRYTAASRHPSTTAFLPPLLALLKQIGIHRYQSVYIPLPLYHGFGLATLIVSLVMGKKIWLTERFDVLTAITGIKEYKIEVIPLVPVMLTRLLQEPDHAECLQSIRCIISGGDKLTPAQLHLWRRYLSHSRLYNLYGTSEAGFFLLATPEQMSGVGEVPIGKPISGVKCKVEQADEHGVGALWVRSGWAMSSLKGQWQNTGDLVWRDKEGRYFHRGRADRMVVCAGENVYLDHVESVIDKQPLVAVSRTYAREHPDFGLVVEADVELKHQKEITEEELLNCLRAELSRSELPHKIHFTTVEVLSTGKKARNKKIHNT